MSDDSHTPTACGGPDDQPYIDAGGTLVIPFTCADHRWKYWKQEGRPLKQVLEELNAPDEVKRRYLPHPDGEAD